MSQQLVRRPGLQVTRFSELGLGCSWSKARNMLKPAILHFNGRCTIAVLLHQKDKWQLGPCVLHDISENLGQFWFYIKGCFFFTPSHSPLRIYSFFKRVRGWSVTMSTRHIPWKLAFNSTRYPGTTAWITHGLKHCTIKMSIKSWLLRHWHFSKC